MATALRFGLVGTGGWARSTHAPALAAAADIELAAVWGRRPEAAQALAGDFGATAYTEIDDFLAGVDAVAFAVPPDVQNPIAVRAAAAGKHLMLEKPVATSAAAASELAAAVTEAGVASVVFFTARFRASVRGWLDGLGAAGGWTGGSALWLGSSLQPGSQFDTPWRHEKGALWDLGPHVVSMLWASLGPVQSMAAAAGPGDLRHLILHHEGGASSVATITQEAAPPGGDLELMVWGAQGRSPAPDDPPQPVTELVTALGELTANVRAGRTSHPCDVDFGARVTRLLATAEQQLAWTGPPPARH
jgi:predicted dehydrogenase